MTSHLSLQTTGYICDPIAKPSFFIPAVNTSTPVQTQFGFTRVVVCDSSHS